MKDAITVVEPQLPSASSVTPMSMLNVAVARGATLDELTKLMDLQDRHEKTEARKAFVVAMNAFKANPPAVLKDKAVSFGNTSYKHASLDGASEIIGAALAQHDISHRWNVEQEGPKIKVTCILTHALGHSESVTMEASADTSGSKNSIQAIGSAVSYLQRYTLFTASGIAPKNVDDDGRGGKGVRQMEDKQKADFLAAIDSLADKKSWETLWQTIASACTKVGDVAAYEELKQKMAAKFKTFPKDAK